MRPLRTPRFVPWWVPALALAAGFAVFVVLVYSGFANKGMVVLILVGSVYVGYFVAEPFVVRGRSRALRSRLTPAEVAAGVDLAAVAVQQRGDERSRLVGVRMVQQAFPELTPADAVEVTRAALPGLVPDRPVPERRSI